MNYSQVTVKLDKKMRALCVFAYPGHPKGCPNFDKRHDCPPKIGFFEDIFDIKSPIFAIWNIFDIEAHVNKMKDKHANWSERQLKCCLYWQPGARKKLKENIISFMREHPGYSATACPEAMGVNITETMNSIGIKLEWPPEKNAYQIALAGIKIRKNIHGN